VRKTNHQVLAASLGFSAGVMIYVSFVEIYFKSIAAFEACDCLWEHDDPSSPARVMSMLMFFGGALFYFLLDALVHVLLPKTVIRRRKRGGEARLRTGSHQVELVNTKSTSISQESCNVSDGGQQQDSCCANAQCTAVDMGSNGGPAAANEAAAEGPGGHSDGQQIVLDGASFFHASIESNKQADYVNKDADSDEGVLEDINVVLCIGSETCAQHNSGTNVEVIELDLLSEEEKTAALNRMGLMTALAIGLHNFPEGLATFAGALADPSAGIALAVAVAIHNIPEGLCVSIPIYYATGSRWRGFLLASISGLAEVVGAALGYWFLISVFSKVAYAVLFGLVSGMMVAIVASELLPTAHRYDPPGHVANGSFFFGMAVMAVSLILFLL